MDQVPDVPGAPVAVSGESDPDFTTTRTTYFVALHVPLSSELLAAVTVSDPDVSVRSPLSPPASTLS